MVLEILDPFNALPPFQWHARGERGREKDLREGREWESERGGERGEGERLGWRAMAALRSQLGGWLEFREVHFVFSFWKASLS